MKRALIGILCLILCFCACHKQEDTQTDVLGHDFTQYLDQEMEAVLAALEKSGIQLADSPNEDPNLWIAMETVGGYECLTYMNFAEYGETSGLRLASYRKQYTMAEIDYEFVTKVYEATTGKLGEPYALNEHMYDEEEYDAKHWDELVDAKCTDIRVYYDGTMVCNSFTLQDNVVAYQEVSPESAELRQEMWD